MPRWEKEKGGSNSKTWGSANGEDFFSSWRFSDFLVEEVLFWLGPVWWIGGAHWIAIPRCKLRKETGAEKDKTRRKRQKKRKKRKKTKKKGRHETQSLIPCHCPMSICLLPALNCSIDYELGPLAISGPGALATGIVPRAAHPGLVTTRHRHSPQATVCLL